MLKIMRCFVALSFVSILAQLTLTIQAQAIAPSAPLPINNPGFDASGEETNAVGYSTSIGWKDVNPSSPAGGVYNNNPVQSAPIIMPPTRLQVH
jgi:hypothetical protein